MDYSYTREEAARYLKVSRSLLDRACARREIAFVRLGRRSYYSRADLDAYVASRRVEVERCT